MRFCICFRAFSVTESDFVGWSLRCPIRSGMTFRRAERAGTGSGGRVHPRTRAGGGARRIQVLAQRGRRRRWEGPEWRPQEAAGTEFLRSQVPACSRRKRGRLSSKGACFEDKWQMRIHLGKKKGPCTKTACFAHGIRYSPVGAGE